MFTVFRAILIVLTYTKYALVGGTARTIASTLAMKVFIASFFGVVFPIVMSFVFLQMQGYMVRYILDYLDTHVDTDGVFPVVMEMTGVAAYLFDHLGLSEAVNIVLTASIIRFSFTFFSRGR